MSASLPIALFCNLVHPPQMCLLARPFVASCPDTHIYIYIFHIYIYTYFIHIHTYTHFTHVLHIHTHMPPVTLSSSPLTPIGSGRALQSFRYVYKHRSVSSAGKPCDVRAVRSSALPQADGEQCGATGKKAGPVCDSCWHRISAEVSVFGIDRTTPLLRPHPADRSEGCMWGI